MKKSIFTFLVLLFGATAFAQSWADSTAVILPDEADLYFPMDRPSQTYNAKTAAKNSWILQMGVNWGSLFKTKQSRDFDLFSFPVNLRYGITDKLEIMISPAPAFAATVGGGGGIEYAQSSWDLALRYSLFKNTKVGSMSVLTSYTHQNYEDGYEINNQLNFKALYSILVGRYLTLGTNLGYISVENDADQFSYTLIASVALSKVFGFYLEGYGNFIIDAPAGEVNPSWFDAGLYYLVSPTFQVDAGYAQGGEENYNEFYTYVGFSYLFGKQ